MSSYSHDQLVASAITEMRRQNMTHIFACLPGYTQPAPINGYIPDAIGSHSSRPVIVEAETADGLNQSHTTSQILAFHQNAVRHGGTFVLVINKADQAVASQLLKRLFSTTGNVLIWPF
jgi:hypothetical protein